jgi:tyrosyl-tRNA synthetase
MSKSLDNYIAVEENPNDMYGKVLRISDAIMMSYFELLTDVPDEELVEYRQALANNSINPMELKKRLAREIVTQFHGADEAHRAEERFASTRQRKEVPAELKIGIKVDASYKVQRDISKRLVEAGLASSISEVKRLIAQGAITVDDVKINTPLIELKDGSIIKVGKRGYMLITDANAMTWKVANL